MTIVTIYSDYNDYSDHSDYCYFIREGPALILPTGGIPCLARAKRRRMKKKKILFRYPSRIERDDDDDDGVIARVEKYYHTIFSFLCRGMPYTFKL